MRSLSGRRQAMDEAGIAIAVLSLPPPGSSLRPGDSGMVRSVNEELVEACASAPDRFRALCALPFPDVAASITELHRVLKSQAIRGVAVTTNQAEWRLDDVAFDPIYDRIAELGWPLFTHPALEPLPPVYDSYALTATVSAVVSSTIGVLRMVYSGTLDRVPNLRLIVPHLGGLIPFLYQRLVDLGGDQHARLPLDHYLRERMFFDTCSYHPPAFRCALETVGVDRLILGTDYPFRGPLARGVEDIRLQAVGEADQEAILGGTSGRWFG